MEDRREFLELLDNLKKILDKDFAFAFLSLTRMVIHLN